MKLTLQIELKAPLHLGSGKGDVVVDAEVVHDNYGLPYFPAKRIKGLLYESALEVVEMGECCGCDIINREQVEKLFGKRDGAVELFIHDLVLPEYEDLKAQWGYLQHEYGDILTSRDVLATYTSLRYQTKIDSETGTAAHGSLHNMRVVDAGLKFVGEVELRGETPEDVKILALAATNLHYAGAKRTRGFGEIACSFPELPKKYSAQRLLGGI